MLAASPSITWLGQRSVGTQKVHQQHPHAGKKGQKDGWNRALRRGEGFGISRAVQSLPAEAVCVFPNSADLGGASSGEGSGASRAGTCTHPVSHRVCTAETWLVGWVRGEDSWDLVDSHRHFLAVFCPARDYLILSLKASVCCRLGLFVRHSSVSEFQLSSIESDSG